MTLRAVKRSDEKLRKLWFHEMIKTSCGYMTPVEAKIIGHIDKEERKRKAY
ncbi:hypothetical protein [Companilactobacillus paralimentarius]|uniref:hypothetical protein n=1 Tax=Companilactobacillus paralimentarius TaxID=83526 RepID=UPI00186B9AE7|nr:hypothetical protein [Companilactobacillus paralimentarius]